MNYNWSIIGDKIFGILRGRGYRLQMFDKAGGKTMDPHEANRFFATVPSNDPNLKSFNILLSLHDEDSHSHLDIKTPNLPNTDDFNTVITLKKSLENNIGDSEGLSINWYKFDHDIDPRDDAVHNISESKDIGKPFGSTKSSYQQIGDSKLIIRHTDPVDESKAGSRWRRIKNIFIETKLGERFVFPYAHVAGARAMARHLANDGRYNDEIGEAISRMSEDYIELKRAGRLLRKAEHPEYDNVKLSLHDLAKKSKRMAGNRGYSQSVQQLEETAPILDEADVIQLATELAETCGCTMDDVSGRQSLNTAARYILALPGSQSLDQRSMMAEDPEMAEIIRIEQLAGLD